MSDKDPAALLNQSPQVDASLQEAEEFFKSENSGKNSPESPAAALDAKISEMERQLEASTQTPGKRYLARLDENKIPLSKAINIIDTVCVRLQPWEEEYKVLKTVQVRFRSRGIASQLEFNKLMESSKVYRENTYMDELRMHALSHSMVKYGTITFDPDNKRQETIAWLGKIPPAVFDMMYARLYEFDEMIRVVFSDGYIENF